MQRTIKMPLAISIIAAMALMAANARAQTGGSPGMMAPGAAMPMQMAPVDAALNAGMARMNREMSAAPMTGDADRDFTAMMLAHHEGAVDMARTELQYGKDPEMRRLARSIIAAQQPEIAQMKDWLAAHPAK